MIDASKEKLYEAAQNANLKRLVWKTWFEVTKIRINQVLSLTKKVKNRIKRFVFD
jgi:hypothetical protein